MVSGSEFFIFPPCQLTRVLPNFFSSFEEAIDPSSISPQSDSSPHSSSIISNNHQVRVFSQSFPSQTSQSQHLLRASPWEQRSTIATLFGDVDLDLQTFDDNDDDDEGIIKSSKPKKPSRVSFPASSHSDGNVAQRTGYSPTESRSLTGSRTIIERSPRPRFTPPGPPSLTNVSSQSQLSNKGSHQRKSSPSSSKIVPSAIPLDVLSFVTKIASTHHSLVFPDSAACDPFLVSNQNPDRKILIPDDFSTMHHYRSTFLNAVYEGMCGYIH